MGSGWHEWPLMIFTVFGQCVAGGFIVLALALMKGDLRAETQQRVIACMFGLWVLMGIGFIASMLHLGSPMRAFNSLNRVGASALSNEIASGSVFFAVGGIGWLLAVLKKLPPALRTLWLIITMVLGVVFVWMMVRVYNSIDTVPTWYSVWTPLGFFLTLFMGGAATGLSAAAHRRRERLGDASVACGFGAGAGGYCHYGGHAGRGTGDDSQFHSAGVCSGAGLWFPDGLAYGAACGGVVLLDCATVKRVSTCGTVALCRLHSDAGGGIDWPRRILWAAYDRGHGGSQLTR
ncbi:anaerobic dimethyl sulfoxide reductase subunit C [Salmonella enterica subsp. enterica serovar Goldcoast]|nr:anaerobic dimethyl sulfoxide reductase subunit C [Salmonella enterica subsp. enterica serovar Goldcoast]